MALSYCLGGYRQVKILGLAGCLPLGLLLTIVFEMAGIDLPWHSANGEYLIAVMLVANWYILYWVFCGLVVAKRAIWNKSP
jgi:hypothetical protein